MIFLRVVVQKCPHWLNRGVVPNMERNVSGCIGKPVTRVCWQDMKFDRDRTIGSCTRRSQTRQSMQSKFTLAAEYCIAIVPALPLMVYMLGSVLRFIPLFFSQIMVADTCGCPKTQFYAVIG